MSEAPRTPTVSELDRELRDELRGKSLVGEMRLGAWGPLAEQALLGLPKSSRNPALLKDRAPAVLVTYLCWQGLHNYNEGTFWPNVSVPELRDGKDTGPAYESALRTLGFSTFEDLEKREGIAMTKRYVRRVHLHGGLPASSVPRLLDLLAATLRHSASTPEEVVDTWITTNVVDYGLDKPAERLLLYTGDFGLGILAGFIALIRAQGRRQTSAVDHGLVPYLVTAYNDWQEDYDASRASWHFVAGPRVEVDRFGPHGPQVRVPAGELDWFVNDEFLGHADRNHEQVFPLPVAQEWKVGRKDGKPVRAVCLDGVSCVWLFDERGRVHRAGTLYGAAAYVVGPDSCAVRGEEERRPLEGAWRGYDLITVGLRGAYELTVELRPDWRLDPVPVDSSWAAELTGDVLGGVKATDGTPVLGDQVLLRPTTGYFPDPSRTQVRVIDRNGGEVFSRNLDRVPWADGEYDLSSLLPDAATGRLRVQLLSRTAGRLDLPVVRLPGLSMKVPLLAPPGQQVLIDVVPATGCRAPERLEIPAGESQTQFDYQCGDDRIALVVLVERCAWDVRYPSTIVAEFRDQEFVVRPDEMRGSVLEILTENRAKLQLWLQDRTGTGLQRVRLFRPPDKEAVIEANLASVIESATSHADNLLDLVLQAFDGRSITLGHVQTGPSVQNLVVAIKQKTPKGAEVVDDGFVGSEKSKSNKSKKPKSKKSRKSKKQQKARESASESSDDGLWRVRIKMSWDEPRPWPDRVVRVWEPTGDQPLEESRVPEGETTAKLKFRAAPGPHLVELAAAGTGWTAPKRPQPGRTCRKVFLGTGAGDVIEAVQQADHRFVITEALPQLSELLADLWLEGLDGEPLSSDQRGVVTSLAFDDPDRLLGFLNRVTSRQSSQPAVRLRSSQRVEVMPLCFDSPLRDLSVDHQQLLSELWDNDRMLAACIDAELGDLWQSRTGWRRSTAANLRNALDQLVTPIAEGACMDGRLLSVKGSDYVPDFSTAEHWYRLLRAPSGSPETDLEAWVKEVEQPSWDGRGRVWAGFVQRVHKALPSDSRPNVVRVLAGAVCELLDPTSTPTENERATSVLSSGLERVPELAETTVVTGVAAMRVLQEAPGWNTRSDT